MVSTLAGSTAGFADGTGTNAKFTYPAGIIVDAQGNVYTTDFFNHTIRKITPSGVVSRLAGDTGGGFADGTGENAKFNGPWSMTVDTQGNVYVADTNNNKIRKITPSGVVSTLVGSTLGFEDGTGANAKFYLPEGIAIDSQSNLYVSDTYNHKIRKITPTGVVSTIVGSTEGFADGMGTSAKFNYPRGIAIDSQGNLFIADTNNHKIRKITPTGVVSTLTGSTSGFEDGTGANAKFNSPVGLTIDSQNNLYIADTSNHKIRKITQE